MSLVPPPPPNLGHQSASYGFPQSQLTDIIHEKERELKKIQEIRNQHLEEMIQERDLLLVESSKRFNILKEDFEYNLSLIEARDKEIERLDNMIKLQNKSFDELDKKYQSQCNTLQLMETREMERLRKAEQDKMMNKVRLLFTANSKFYPY
jgi:hypothetical protein